MNLHILRQQNRTQKVLYRTAAGIPRHRIPSCVPTAGQEVVLIFLCACSHDNEDRSSEITPRARRGFNYKWDTRGNAEFRGMRNRTYVQSACTKLHKINALTPNDPYSGRTAPLTSKSCILCIYSTNIGTEYFKHGIHPSFFFCLQNAVCFIILTYLVPVLFTFYIQGVLKLKK